MAHVFLWLSTVASKFAKKIEYAHHFPVDNNIEPPTENYNHMQIITSLAYMLLVVYFFVYDYISSPNLTKYFSSNSRLKCYHSLSVMSIWISIKLKLC